MSTTLWLLSGRTESDPPPESVGNQDRPSFSHFKYYRFQPQNTPTLFAHFKFQIKKSTIRNLKEGASFMTPTESSIKKYIQNLEQLHQTMTKIGLSAEVTATIEASLQVARAYQKFLPGNK